MSGFHGKVINIDDGYVGTLNVGAIVFTASETNPIPGNAFGIYRSSNDSFAISDPTAGSSTIIIENTFNLTLDSYVDYTTFQDNKTAQEEINDTILTALDGYTTEAGSGVSDQTFQENKTAQEEINDTILTALDGYAAVQGTATQIAYFSGTNTLTSDTNLSFDTTNNRLLAHSIQVTGGQQNDGYVLTSDANGVASWQRPPIALASNKIYTVDAAHPAADFTTIQAAINAASDGYIILVSPGSYNEQLNLRAGITMEIRGTGPDYASSNIEYVLSGDGYVINGPDAGAGSIVFKNMNIALRYNGISGSTATILARSTSFGWIFRDCYITAYTLSASGGQTHAILANASSLMEFTNCEIVADDNDGIGNVECIRIAAATIGLYNTTTYGMNNYDIHVDDPAASLYIEGSTIAGTLNVVRASNVFMDRVSLVGAVQGVSDIDTESTLQHRVYGVGLTNGQNDFYKLHLREIGQVNVGSPGDGQIWYSRAAGRFRMQENGTVKDMIPYDVLDGYGGGGGVSETTFQENKNAQNQINQTIIQALDGYADITQASGFSGSDGYVAFFTGNNNMAGDNDLFWDRVSGELGINTITPSAPLHVMGNDTASAMFVQNDFDGYAAEFFNDGNSPNRAGIKIRCGQDTPGAGSSVSAIFVIFAEGDDAITGQISATTAGVVSLVDVSDEAKKTNISPTSINALDIVNNIELIEYSRIKKNVEYDKVDIGFSAQNCQESYPAMVSSMVDGSLGIAKSELIPVLTKAIQEQDAKIKDQQEQIDELKKLVKKLLKE